MAIDQIISKILEDTYTTNKLKARIPLLKDYLVASFFGSIDEFKKKTGSSELIWLDKLDQEFFSTFNKQNVYEIFGQIEAYMDQIKPLVIYLPITIPEPELVEMGKKLRSSYGANFVFDLKFDPDLIAGCAIVWNGVYKDYSIRSAIEAKKNDILQSFKQFISK